MSTEEQVEALAEVLTATWNQQYNHPSRHYGCSMPELAQGILASDFLASVRRDAGAEALREAASHVESSYGFISSGAAARWLRERADLLAGEDS